MLIDTHCHLIDEAFQADVDEVIHNAIDAGVGKMVLACCDETEYPRILALCRQYPGILYPTIGIHPENMAPDIHSQFAALFPEAPHSSALVPEAPHSSALFPEAPSPDLIAVGEVGLDLHWDRTRLADQLWLLEAQVNWALDHDLPLILHIRDAMDEFLALCRDTLYNNAHARGKRLRGILHCYSGTIAQADETLQYGDFVFGIGGTSTYKKSAVPEVARHLGLSRLVLETDAPYLAPVPHRGQRNQPAYTAITAVALSNTLGVTLDEVAEKTTANARQLFNI